MSRYARGFLLLVLVLTVVGPFVFGQNGETDPVALIEQIRDCSSCRAEARAQLVALGEAAVPALIDATRDRDAWVRWEAVNALGTIEDPRGIPALVERALIDDNPHPRWRSLWAVSVFPLDDILPGLRAGLDSENPTFVWNAVIALAFFAQPEIGPQLNEAALTTTDFAQWEAVFSLGRVSNEESIHVLTALMLDPEQDLRIRQEAANTLGKIADPATVPALIAALDDPEEGVQWRAASALRRIGDRQAIPALEIAIDRAEATLAELRASLSEAEGETEVARIEARIAAVEFALEQMEEALQVLRAASETE